MSTISREETFRKNAAILSSRMVVHLLCIPLLLSGCGPTLYAAFSDSGYKHTEYGYSVSALSKGPTFLPSYWQIDNFYYDRRHDLVPKKGADYEVEVYVDWDKNGENDDIGEFYTYDLRFTHTRNAGVIWLRTIPISPSLRNKELRVMAQSYVESAAATYYEVVQLGGRLYYSSKEKTYATKIVGRATGTVAGQEAYSVTVDVADVQQLKLSPTSRKERVLLVLIRTPFEFKDRSATGNFAIPVLMIAGYSNLVEDFDEWLSDFQQFVSRIVMNGIRGARFKEITVPQKRQSKQEEPVEESQPSSQPERETDEIHTQPESVTGEIQTEAPIPSTETPKPAETPDASVAN